MATTAFDLDFLLSNDRDTRDEWDRSWLSPLPPSFSGLCGFCGFSTHESVRFPLYPQVLLDGFTGYDASYNSLDDYISNPTTAFNSYPLFFDTMKTSWDTYGLSGHDMPCSVDLGYSWAYSARHDLIIPQNYNDTATACPAVDDTYLEDLVLDSGALNTEPYDGNLLQSINDLGIQTPSSAPSDSGYDDTDAVVLTGEGSVLPKLHRPSRPVSEASSQTDISTAGTKRTAALDDNDDFTKALILEPPFRAENFTVKDTSSEGLPAKRQKVSSRSPRKRRKTTPPCSKSQKPSPNEHNFRIDRITCGNRKYQWSRRKGVWESDGDLLQRSDVPFDEVTEVEVFPDGPSSQQVVLSRQDVGLFCGIDAVWERYYSVEGDTILRLVMDPDKIQKAPESIV